MTRYDPAEIEPRWQQRWHAADLFRCETEGAGEPFYCLEMLPYPSGRLHMGHVRNYTIGDAVARYQRMRGRRVMHVMGWDAFGLPAENAAIQHGTHPRRWTEENIEAMRRQARRLGWGYDWSREISTCEADYYRWNQWFFLRMLERGLVYRARRPVNWCPSCATVLANEQVHGGRCWRCGEAVTERDLDQWFVRIRDYADELLQGLEALEGWPERVRRMQAHWIGRSEGAAVGFPAEGLERPIEVFTTRLDTIYGATYLALAPDHPDLEALVAGSPQAGAVRSFVARQRGRTLVDRFSAVGEKEGVFTGRYARNPFTGERIPIWVADFVLAEVGTGAVMSVPAHDQRDFEFARKYGLPLRCVVRAPDGLPLTADRLEAAYTEDGVLHDSGPYTGLSSAQARERMLADVQARGWGGRRVVYRLRDWGISRQRYWGTPIPVIHCELCGPVPVPEEELPVRLPEQAPLTGEGGSPLARLPEFVRAACPRCGTSAQRDTDTMDTFVDSSWYFFRYLDPHNARAPFDTTRVRPWLPVDLYIGGIEHATMHLIYTRFWTKMMRDLGLVAIDEPVRRLFTQGMVIKDGAKMSKSRGNIVDPDAMVARYGADTTRLFSLFAAPPEKDLEWSEAGVEGCWRFLQRVWRAFDEARAHLGPPNAPRPAGVDRGAALELRRVAHRTIARVTEDLLPERLQLNTAVAAIMELTNAIVPLSRAERLDSAEAWALREAFEILARLLAPFAPHLAEQLWEGLGHPPFVSAAAWPEAEAELLVRESVTIVVQVNGRLRGRVELPRGASEAEALEAARAEPRVSAYLDGRRIERVVYVPDRLLNLVVR